MNINDRSEFPTDLFILDRLRFPSKLTLIAQLPLFTLIVSFNTLGIRSNFFTRKIGCPRCRFCNFQSDNFEFSCLKEGGGSGDAFMLSWLDKLNCHFSYCFGRKREVCYSLYFPHNIAEIVKQIS